MRIKNVKDVLMVTSNVSFVSACCHCLAQYGVVVAAGRIEREKEREREAFICLPEGLFESSALRFIGAGAWAEVKYIRWNEARRVERRGAGQS